ncbi:hypothetical protein [Halomonas halocynthiae]|uniref:hypothetical protein n=1 Tax=Halomonas halocynthiae TaxID=176290 RepID=UPI00048216B7|nr:hypothetical protein [Halomonas halocynthiae]
MNICVIGSSHVAALKAAWDNEAAAWPVRMTFFAAPGGIASKVKSSEGIICSTDNRLKEFWKKTSGGEEKVNLRRYDALVIVGLQFSFPLLRAGLSRQVREVLISDVFCFSKTFSFISMVRKSFSGPIVVCPRPLYPEGSKAATREDLVESFDDTLEALEEEGSGLQILFTPPPLKALSTDRRFTRPEYLSGAPSLKGGEFNADKDFDREAHANEAYGSLVLREIFEKLGISQID